MHPIHRAELRAKGAGAFLCDWLVDLRLSARFRGLLQAHHRLAVVLASKSTRWADPADRHKRAE